MGYSFHYVKNNASGNLSQTIDISSTVIPLDSGDRNNFPASYPFYVTVGNEIMDCTNADSTSLIVTRAQQSTTASTFLSSTPVEQLFTADNLTEIQTQINYILDGTSTLSKLTISGTADVTGILSTYAAIKINHIDPEIWFNETDQTGSIGLFRFHGVGGQFYLQQNTAAAKNFSTSTNNVIFNSGGQMQILGALKVGAALDVTGTTNLRNTTTVNGSLGNIEFENSGAALNFSRAGINYLRATNAAGSFNFLAGDATGIAELAIDSTSVSISTIRVKLTNLPTSSSGLTAGMLWNNAGVVNIV